MRHVSPSNTSPKRHVTSNTPLPKCHSKVPSFHCLPPISPKLFHCVVTFCHRGPFFDEAFLLFPTYMCPSLPRITSLVPPLKETWEKMLLFMVEMKKLWSTKEIEAKNNGARAADATSCLGVAIKETNQETMTLDAGEAQSHPNLFKHHHVELKNLDGKKLIDEKEVQLEEHIVGVQIAEN
ncbi:hypothetical protein VNO78_03302 [Psophocarpus tetragonolobus]|uniref:Uncharacterized protein n=1 Tax=Psophocarpus tetragonolobus TaxID=3891 RepID=A0AAN9T0W8_PSOTE